MISISRLATATDAQLSELLAHLDQRASNAQHRADYRLATTQAHLVRGELASRAGQPQPDRLPLTQGDRFVLAHPHSGLSSLLLVSASPASAGGWDVVYTRHGGVQDRLFHETARLRSACQTGCCLTPA